MSHEHGGDIVGSVLAEHGCSAVFTLCGGHISPILTGAEKHGLRIIDVRHEVSAVFAADAVARMTGVCGVAAVTAGPGVTNTMTAVKNAMMAQSPVLILGGATATILRGKGSLQDIDQMSLMAPVTKWCTRVTTVNAIESTIRKAIAVAEEGVPGPVFVELPVDLLYPEEVVVDWYMKDSGVKDAQDLGSRALRFYLRSHLTRVFKQPHLDFDLGLPLPEFGMPAFVSGSVDDARAALAKAKQPALVVGSQALVNRTVEEARAIADAIERLGIPTWLGGTARGLLGKESDIQFRHKRSAALRKADVVIVAGFPFDFRLGYGRSINKKATLIAANLSREDLTKNRRPDIALTMHPGDMIEELARGFSPPAIWTGWFDAIREREDTRDLEIAEQAREKHESGLINPLDFFVKMEALMDDDAVLVVDGGDFVASGAYVLRPRKPLNWLDPGVFGTLGVGGGFTAGACASRPDSEVWLIWGDGSSGYSLAEFDTFVRHGMAPIAVIGTDASWAQIAREQVEVLGTALGTELLRTDYHRVAAGYGGVGLKLTDPSKINITIKKAKKLASEGKPVCINVHIAPSDFRKGSISI